MQQNYLYIFEIVQYQSELSKNILPLGLNRNSSNEISFMFKSQRLITTPVLFASVTFMNYLRSPMICGIASE